MKERMLLHGKMFKKSYLTYVQVSKHVAMKIRHIQIFIYC